MCSINMIFNFGRYAGGSICKIQNAPPLFKSCPACVIPSSAPASI